MATGRGKGARKAAESWVGQPDPRAPLDGRAFLAAAKPVLAVLTEDLLARADGSVGVTRALKLRHAKEREEQRTADGYEVWRRQVVVQVAAAWLLSCVFVRTLEDRGLLARNRIAGVGARDGQQMFFQIAPYLTERDYLLAVFREVAHLDAVRGLFARERSLVWRLAPSAAAARRVLELFRAGDAEAPAFRFGQADTRFLGDLYQDLNEEVRERFALLQTPDFVEEFILDRTLEPALEKFGLERTELIDPTCGSGHFLLGAFGRLVERRLREEPGLDAVEAATKALDAVYGVDVNPYAVMIARFRLTLAWLERAGFTRLEGAPRVEPNVVVADSLLFNMQVEQRSLVELEGVSVSAWELDAYRLEDDAGAKRVLGKTYAAVVGNPPYITVKDAVLRERYRAMYKRSAAGKYSIAAPFTERFFQLARAGGRVGMITANSFMKREFGKKLIEEFLPTVNLDVIVNTSGAYIPGHGTPTVLLFGGNEKAVGAEVLTVLANRGEPGIPEDPRMGLVWSSITGHWSEVGYEDEYVSVVRTGREGLGQHPWSLGGGGAADVKAWLEERAEEKLSKLATSIGFMAISGEDDAFARPRDAWLRTGAEPEWIYDFGIGEEVRDWSHSSSISVFFPYRDASLRPPEEYPRTAKALWPHRRLLHNRPDFGGKKYIDVGRPWYSFHQVPLERLKVTHSIAYAEVATHNHFVLDRGGKVFKQTAPIIKLSATASDDDHLALLAYLNSSTACFWMKQVAYPKGMHNGSAANATPFLVRYAFDGTKLRSLPLPPRFTDPDVKATLSALGRELDTLARERSACLPADEASTPSVIARRHELLSREIALQETIDWFVYDLFELTDVSVREHITDRIAIGQRPFELHLAATEVQTPAGGWFHWIGTDPRQALHTLETSEAITRWFRAWEAALAKQPMLKILEGPENKRRWIQPAGKAAQELETDEKVVRNHVAAQRVAWIEPAASSSETCFSARSLRRTGSGDTTELEDHLAAEAVPFLSSLRYSDTGLEKHAAWRRCWALQREEDAGKPVTIEVPPKYEPKDFANPAYYRLRGPLDVPKERFIAYPGCASTLDPSPVYGWAGWDHAQRAQALAQLYLSRKTEEAWPAERLTPMLAGLDELLFWLELWHGDPHPDYGMPLSTFYADFISSECRELGLTLDDLRSWRPPKGFGKPAKAAKPAKPPKPAKPKRADAGPVLTNPTFTLTSDPDPSPAPKPEPPRKPRAPKKPSTRS